MARIFDLIGYFGLFFDERNFGSTTRESFKSKRAGSSKEVKNFHLGYIGTDPVKKCFPDPIGRRSQPFLVDEFQSMTFKTTGDNTYSVIQHGAVYNCLRHWNKHIFHKKLIIL